MTFSVYQHWDPLKVCVVGKSYPPEFYSWIKVPHVRSLFEKIAIETEEDFQAIIKKLKEFGVEIIRPEIDVDRILELGAPYLPPPMTPRDWMCMIGDRFFYSYTDFDFKDFYSQVRDASWPECDSLETFDSLPKWIKDECYNLHNLEKWIANNEMLKSQHHEIYSRVKQENNIIVGTREFYSCGAMVSRIGKDLYFGTDRYDTDISAHQQKVDQVFTDTRNHVVNTGGHGDGTYCPVCPGLIVSLLDVPTYATTFPDWEVIYLPNQSWEKVRPFLDLKEKNKGKWWIPGFEQDQEVIDVVENWLNNWTGYVEETVFDVNMLIIDPKNVMVFNYNKQVFDAFDRYGITAHVVPFRHRYFWDGGIHCVTSDLHREGQMQDYFPGRT